MDRSRRAFLRAGSAAAVGTMTALAGCSGVNPLGGGSDSGGGGTSNVLSHIPEGVSYVGRGDVTRTLNDSAVTQFTNAILGQFANDEYYSGPTTKSELLNMFKNNAGIALSGANTVVGYGNYAGQDSTSSGPYYGFYIEADWSTDAVVSALESGNLAFTKSEYNGQTLYEAGREYQQLWLGVAGADSYVLATESATKDALDVAAGNMNSVGSSMRTAFGNVRDAPFKFAATVPTSQLPTESIQVGGSTIDPQRFATVSHVTGATYHNGDTVGITTRLLTGGSGEAEDVANALSGGLAAVAEATRNETLAGALNDVSVSTDGSVVVAQVSGSVDRATTVITAITGLFFGV